MAIVTYCRRTDLRSVVFLVWQGPLGVAQILAVIGSKTPCYGKIA